MAKQREKIYRRKRPVRTFFKILTGVLLLAVVLAVFIFFQFQHYIMYTSEGIRLQIPWLEDILDDLPEDASAVPPTPTPEPEAPSPEPEDSGSDAPSTGGGIRAVAVSSTAQLSDTQAVLAGLSSSGANTLMISVKDSSGRLGWASEVPMAAVSYDTISDHDLAADLAVYTDAVAVSALLSCFYDELMSTRNQPASLPSAEGGASAWLNPADEGIQGYITDLCLELGDLGVKEIVLNAYTYPPGISVELSDRERQQVILDFLTSLSKALSRKGVTLSLATEWDDWNNTDDSLDMAALAEIAERFYCALSDDEQENTTLLEKVEAYLGDDMDTRFVPVYPDELPETGSGCVSLY